MSFLTRLRLMAHLGPLFGDTSPRAYVQLLDEGAHRARVYAPRSRRPRGSYFIVPGLHFAGPADVRMDRFCRALADAGFFVYAPHLPTFESLRIEATAIDETAAAFARFWQHPSRPLDRLPAVFTISFGSLPGLALAAHPRHRSRIGTLITFGGALDIDRALTFAVGAHGDEKNARDPLNLPAVFLNLEGRWGVSPDVEQAARAGWHRFVRRTWGRPDMKDPVRYRALARDLAEDVPRTARALFLLGCGAGGNPAEAVARAVAAHGRVGFSVRDRLADIRCEVVGFHGLDDDVIPHQELDRLGEALPPSVRFSGHKTGWVDHTRSAEASLAQGRALLAEAQTMWSMLSRLTDGARKPIAG